MAFTFRRFLEKFLGSDAPELDMTAGTFLFHMDKDADRADDVVGEIKTPITWINCPRCEGMGGLISCLCPEMNSEPERKPS